MGFEGSGIVRAVGPEVDRFSVGDRIMYLGAACFATYHTVHDSLCVKMDDSMSYIQGATVPCVYATAYMALVDIPNLQQKQVSRCPSLMSRKWWQATGNELTSH